MPTFLPKIDAKSILTYILWGVSAIFLAIIFYDTIRLINFSDRGFDFTDEGFYALSYSTHQEVGRSFTGSTSIIGLLYDATGQSIRNLRIIKPFVLLSAGGFIGWQTASWISTYITKYREEKDSVLTKYPFKTSLALGAALCSLSPYIWTPATPNYNDLNLIFLLCLSGMCIKIANIQFGEAPERKIYLCYLVVGFIYGLGAFNKSSTAAAALFLIIPVFFQKKRSLKSLTKLLFFLTSGFILFWIILSLFIANSFSVINDSYKLLKIISLEGYSPGTLVTGYSKTIIFTTRDILTQHSLLLIVAFLFGFGLQKMPVAAKSCGGLVILGLAVKLARDSSNFQGGAAATVGGGQILIYVLCLFGLALTIGYFASLLIWKSSPSPDKSPATVMPTSDNFPRIAILWLLCMFPFAQAMGTNNDVFTGASFSNVGWILACVVLASVLSVDTILSYILFAICIFGTWAIHHKAMDGFLDNPYRLLAKTSTLSKEIKYSSPLQGIKVDNRTYSYLKSLNNILKKSAIPERTYMLGIWNLPGEIYALNGISPGEPWYISGLPIRNSNNIKFGCSRGQIGPDKLPVILVNQDIDSQTISTLEDCEIIFPDDYRLVGKVRSPFTDQDTKVYIPRSGY